MGYFQVRYDSRVVIYDRRAFIRLATVVSESTCFRTYKALANATAHTYIDFGLNRQIWVDENYSTKAVEVIYKFYWLKLVMCHAISRMLHFRSDHTVVKSVLQGVAPILKKP